MSAHDVPAGSVVRRAAAARLALGPRAEAPASAGLLMRVSGTIFEIVFLGYLAGVAAFSRDFAHLSLTVRGVPLFAGELALLTLTILAIAISIGRNGLRFELDLTSWALLLLLAVGAIFTFRGLLTSQPLAVLRDFALVYYGWFFFLTPAYLRQGGNGKRVLGAYLLGAVVGSLVDSGRFLASPALIWGHGAPGYDGLFAWGGIVVALAVAATETGALWRAALAGGIVVCTFTLFLTGYRTLIAVAAVAVVTVTVWSWLQGGRAARRLAALAWVWAALIAAIILVPRFAIPSPAQVVPPNGPVPMKESVGSISHRWTGDRFGAAPDRRAPDGARLPDPQTWRGSAQFRFRAWRNAVAKIGESPWVGVGFGPQVLLFPAENCDTMPSPTSNCGTAHNTYLTIAMRMGVPSAIFLCALLGSLLIRTGVASLRPGFDSANLLPIVAAATVLLSFLLFGLTGLLFESPYLSPVVWVLAGILAESARIQGRRAAQATPA